MKEYLKEESNFTYTENGAKTLLSTNSNCLDLFSTIGALRGASDEEIECRFMRAFAENREMAMRILFFARDVRGGLGERKTSRAILKWLADNEPAILKKNIELIPEYGRFDDLLSLIGSSCEEDALAFIKKQLQKDLEAVDCGKENEVSLLGKWLPSVNASNSETKRTGRYIAKKLGITESKYRKILVLLRKKINIIENNLREKDYTFDYSKQPSQAMFKYRKAFIRNDNERYTSFLNDVKSGKKTMHTGTLLPYEIIRPCFKDSLDESERSAVDATWNALENDVSDDNSLVVVDGSGSMYWNSCCDDGSLAPIQVAISLGMYFAERNNGAFHNSFITFSEDPRLIEINGKDIYEKVMYCMSFNEAANTDISKVFKLILDTALKHDLDQSDMPKRIYIVSDMEFDCCVENANETNFEYAKKLFEENGYKLPELVFWKVSSRNVQQPVKENDLGVALVSGCTPRLFSMMTEGIVDPYRFMVDTLYVPRYDKVSV